MQTMRVTKVKLSQSLQILWGEHINIHYPLDFSYIYQWLSGFRYQSQTRRPCLDANSFFLFMFLKYFDLSLGMKTSPKSYKVCWNTFSSKGIATHFRYFWCYSLWSVSLDHYKVFSMELWHNKRIGILNSGFTQKNPRKISISSFKK